MKTKEGSSKKILKLLSLMIISAIMIYSCYVYHNYTTYNSIKITTIKKATVEYGSANYDINNLIKKVEGEIISIKKDIDTNVVGEQEVVVEVKKENVVKQVPILVNVVDTIAPTIELNEEKITVDYGADYAFTDNISSVRDDVDGDISYSGEVDDNSTLYYNFSYNQDEIDEVGSHEVVVNAKDSNGNVTTKTFIYEVLAPKKVYSVSTPVYSNVAPNASGGDLVSIAYSLIGSPYISGANGPYGFDCSGFVQYVYSRVGIGVSRSTSTQLYDGVGISYSEAQPGDILSWGYYDGVPTHSALYVGNGQMVHATNPSQGVIASDVAAWTRGSGTHIISVRRIQ